jgi:mono/diheme cytochrome c family protein
MTSALVFFALIGEPELTYTKNVRPILKQHCAQCHNKRVLPHLDWGTYPTAFKFRNSIKNRVRNKSMPPGGGNITDEGRVVILKWILQGAKE